MSTIKERAPLTFHTPTKRDEIVDLLARAEQLTTELAGVWREVQRIVTGTSPLAARTSPLADLRGCTGWWFPINPDFPEEGMDVRHEGPCPVHVDLGVPTGPSPVISTCAVSDVPVDGTVEVRGVTSGGRFGPWGHVIGEQEVAVGGQGYRSLLIGGLVEPWTWHMDQVVQVRPWQDQERRWENPR